MRRSVVVCVLVSGCFLDWDRVRPLADATSPKDVAEEALDAEFPEAEAPDGDGSDRPAKPDGQDVGDDLGPDAMDAGTPDAMDAGAGPEVLDAADATDLGDVGADANDAARPDAADVADVPAVGIPLLPCAAPTLDGTIGADWASDREAVVRNSVATTWGAGQNELRALHVCYDRTALYLGIEGTVELQNGLIVYLDRDYRPGAPAGVTRFADLTDRAGELDRRVSAGLALNAELSTSLGLEAAWGTAGMVDLDATETSPTVGLRMLWPDRPFDRRRDFAWTRGAASRCRKGVGCEVGLAWSALFDGAPPSSTTVAVFARIHSADGAMTSNQTLPMDDAANPRTVGRVLAVQVRF